ncbi:MAG: hypothetical protein AAGC46_00850 [Solirubrobacteraceae bacterium]|nr:hypothetical protein [Patulibacter sp.]
MGLFGKTPAPAPEDLTSRQYVAVAPPGPRTTNLASAAYLAVRSLPIASAERFGALLTIAEVSAATETVRALMIQDRDLSGWVARKALVQLHAILGGAMSNDYGQNLERAYSAAGFVAPPGGVPVRPSEPAPHLDDTQLAGSIGLGTLVQALLSAVVVKDVDANPGGMAQLSDLYTGASGEDVETTAYDVIAWVSIVLSRLDHGGEFSTPVPFFDEQFRAIPRLARAGWYPNPANAGGIENGDARFQRFWDGAWTDRVRLREGKGWSTGSVSLHQMPSD